MKPSRVRRLLQLLLPAACLAALASCCHAAPRAPSRAARPEAAAAPAVPEALLREDAWFEVSLDGAHVGWMHRVRAAGPGRTVVTREDAQMEILRYGEALPVRTSYSFVETAAGEPVSFESRTSMSREESRSRGRIRGGRLEVATETAGGGRESAHEWPEGALFPYGADLLALRSGLEPGTGWSYRTWSPELNGLITETVRVAGPEEVATAEGTRRLRKIVVSTREMTGQETFLWLDEGMRQVVLEVPSLKFRMARVDEARARRKAEPSADLAQSSFVPVEIDEGAAARGGRVVYRMVRASGSWEGTELEDARQKVVTREGGTVVLEVRRGELPKGPAAGAAAAPAELLKATPYLETDSPEVRRALREALGAEAGIREMRAEEAARRLALWVRDQVDERTLDVGFATAAEVARDRKGDCTEHAVLLAAMLRAAGIASRVRAGLLYVGGGFGYHLWTQAWLGGGWVDLDPTLGDGPVDPLHIGLATSDLGNESPLLGIAALGPLVGDLKIEVVEVGGGASPAPPLPEAPQGERPGPR